MSRNVGFTRYVWLYFRERVFSNAGWPEWFGGVLIGIINVFFLAWALKPFTIFSGYLNWGQHIYDLIGLNWLVGRPGNPLLDITGVGDIGLLLGAFTAAVFSHEFRIRKPLSSGEYLNAVLGGLLMSLGVVLASGCNWGGFLSAITVLSLHGFLMFVGLIIGGWLGLLYVKWVAERTIELVDKPLTVTYGASLGSKGGKNLNLALASVPLVILLILTLIYTLTNNFTYIGVLLMGFAVGTVLQRCRFCFATAFRDLINGPELRRSLAIHKGIISALFIGVTGSFILKYLGYVDPLTHVAPSNFTNVIGGILFGLGMVIAGGCASGTLWRAAEGHVKFWLTLLTAVITFPVLRGLILKNLPWIFGPKVFIPYALGWGLGLTTIYIALLTYLTFVVYLEYRFSRGGLGG